MMEQNYLKRLTIATQQAPAFYGSSNPSSQTELSIPTSPARSQHPIPIPKTPESTTPAGNLTPTSSRSWNDSAPWARKPIHSDRFIPIRENDMATAYAIREPTTPTRKRKNPGSTPQTPESRTDDDSIYNAVIRNELVPSLSDPMDDWDPHNPKQTVSPGYLTNRRKRFNEFTYHQSGPSETLYFPNDSPLRSRYTVSPLTKASQALLQSPRRVPRHISKTPYKVLDAPELHDDFYLNLVDWSSQNFLAVGLGTCVYLWNASNSKVSKLCDLNSDSDSVTSLAWMQRGTHIAVGTNKGRVLLWDVAREKKIQDYTAHTQRVGVLAWNNDVLTSGGRDRIIAHRDVKNGDKTIKKVYGHKLEVCGLKWNPSRTLLASGGNDNKLLIWNKFDDKPVQELNEHIAAVKAIAWSPHEDGLLASGGGTADRKLRFWNTKTGSLLNTLETGSQVCNLAWSKNSNEIVSTHGYSQNQIVVWKYPDMLQLATLTGHSYRVLYLAMSPDGQNIVTGAGDETLRFWNVFPKGTSKEIENSAISPLGEKIATIR
ncbi:Fizzy- protein [Nowakowskiella sp. JEL0078]|nr:Fizzy- protein [Nowakowskiella sp. JEL0078]